MKTTTSSSCEAHKQRGSSYVLFYQYIEISLVHRVIQLTRVRANRQIAKVSIVRLEEEIDGEERGHAK